MRTSFVKPNNELQRLRKHDAGLLLKMAGCQLEMLSGTASKKVIRRYQQLCEQHSDCLKHIGALALAKEKV